MKKASIEINFIFTVAITVMIILIIMVLFFNLPIKNKLYCNTVGKLVKRDLNYLSETDPCYEKQKIQDSRFELNESGEYDLTSELVQHILDCWARGYSGQYKSNILCEGMSIPKSYVFKESITEALVTEHIIKRQVCHLIGNSDYGCGDKDNLDFATISQHTNILIEYNAQDKKIIVK